MDRRQTTILAADMVRYSRLMAADEEGVIARLRDAHIWADRWDRTMADLFELQDELTSAIVTGVEPELGAHERGLARRKPTET